MPTDAMRERFEAWLGTLPLTRSATRSEAAWLAWQAAYAAGAAEEREACAKIAEDEECCERSEYGAGCDAAANEIARKIRARGKAE